MRVGFIIWGEGRVVFGIDCVYGNAVRGRGLFGVWWLMDVKRGGV